MQSSGTAGQWFSSTHWSVIAQAVATELPGSQEALGALYQIYWRPFFLYALLSGRSPEDARDLTQGFFENLIAKSYLASADPQRGRFRSFLLSSFKQHLAHEHEKASAQKRVGGVILISLESDLEQFTASEPADHRTPEFLFEQRWAMRLFEQVLGRLRAVTEMSGHEAVFDAFKHHLAAEASEPYAAVAARIGMTEGAAKMFVTRGAAIGNCSALKSLGP